MSTMHSTMSDINRFLKFPSTASRLLCLVVCPWIGGHISQRYLFSTSVVSYEISKSFSVSSSHAPLLPVASAVSSFSAVFALSAVDSPSFPLSSPATLSSIASRCFCSLVLLRCICTVGGGLPCFPFPSVPTLRLHCAYVYLPLPHSSGM